MSPPPNTGAVPTRLLVIRHGESEWNVLRRWQGRADPPMSAEGIRQAIEAGDLLAGFDAIWSSDLQRASLTANIIADIIGIGPVQLDQRLRETHVGPWEGLTHDEIEIRWPGYLAGRHRPEGFESDHSVATRALAAFADIAAAVPGGEVIVITHAGITRSVRRHLGAADGHVPNLGGCWFNVAGSEVAVGDIVNLVGAEPTGMVL